MKEIKLEEYIQLVTSQYQNSPKFLKWLYSIISPYSLTIDYTLLLDSNEEVVLDSLGSRVLVEAEGRDGLYNNSISNFFIDLYAIYSLDYATSDRLDYIGELVGVNRILPFIPTPVGSPPVAVSSTMTDAIYKKAIIAKIGINHWDGKIQSIKDIWQVIFPGVDFKIVDNLDMSFNCFVSGILDQIYIDLLEHDMLIPRPEGVLLNYSVTDLPVFGFDSYTDYIAGFDEGKWAL